MMRVDMLKDVILDLNALIKHYGLVNFFSSAAAFLLSGLSVYVLAQASLAFGIAVSSMTFSVAAVLIIVSMAVFTAVCYRLVARKLPLNQFSHVQRRRLLIFLMAFHPLGCIFGLYLTAP